MTSTRPGTGAKTDAMTIGRAQREFAPTTLYLNTASLGLPPARTTAALHEVIDAIARGEVNAPDFDGAVADSRAQYAQMVGVSAADVAIGSQASAMVGLIAASLPDDGQVLLAEGDFTSVMFPFLAQAPRGVGVQEVSLVDLPGTVTDATTVVAVSAVQSAERSPGRPRRPH